MTNEKTISKDMQDKLYEKETHITYNELETTFDIDTYDKRLADRFSKNTNTTICEHKTDLGILYSIQGKKADLNIDIYK